MCGSLWRQGAGAFARCACLRPQLAATQLRPVYCVCGGVRTGLLGSGFLAGAQDQARQLKFGWGCRIFWI